MKKQTSIADFFGKGAKRSKSNRPKKKRAPTGISLRAAPKKEIGKHRSGAAELCFPISEYKKKIVPLIIETPMEELSFEDYKDRKIPEGCSHSFYLLASVMNASESTTKHYHKILYLTNLFRFLIVTGAIEDLKMSVHLLLGKIGPDYLAEELGVGEKLIIKAIGQATNLKKVNAKGKDLGDLVEKSKRSMNLLVKPKPLTIQSVFQKLVQLSELHGSRSQNDRVSIMSSLITSGVNRHESKYLVRIFKGSLRIGVLVSKINSALSNAFLYWEEHDQSGGKGSVDTTLEIVKQCYTEYPNFNYLIDRYFEHPSLLKLHEWVHITPGIPSIPMLAKPTKGLDEIFEKVDNQDFVCEFKYDGERGQIHCLPDGQVKIFSRGLEDSTVKFPEIPGYIKRSLKAGVTDCILDSEIVGFDRETKKFRSFQELSTRSRKNVDVDNEITVCVNVFDILYFNGKSLLNVSLEERREILFSEVLTPTDGEVHFVVSKKTSDPDEILEFFNEALENRCEGLMIKILKGEKSFYQPSVRTTNWLKMKKEYIQGMVDTLDLVIVGAFHGKGKRQGTWGKFLLAAYDPETDQFPVFCKVGTGFSDSQLTEFKELLSPKIISSKDPSVDMGTGDVPDVWIKPSFVVEIGGADFTLSPAYRAGFGFIEPGKSISLRFPTFKRLREDKKPRSCTSVDQIREMYLSQYSMK